MTLVLEIFETSPSTELPCKLPVQRRSCVFAAWKVGLALSVMACLSLVPLSVMACLSPASLSMTREKKKEAGMVKVFFPDRFHRTAGHRFRLAGPVGPVTGSYRSNSKLNSNVPVETASTG